MRDARCVIVVSLLAGLLGQQAQADLYDWTWDRPDQDYIDAHTVGPNRYTIPNGEVNDSAGIISSLSASYDSFSRIFSWSATFAGQPDGSGYHRTNGFWLAVSPGPMPNGTGQGQLAQIFFDGSGDDPALTGYAYNGLGNGTSFFDGSHDDGIQPPDPIFSSFNDPGMILDIFNTENPDGSITLGFEIDAALVQDHSPAYPGSGPWTGVSFGELIGVWTHPFTRLQTSYEDGYLTDFTFARHGWWDAADQEVPAPAPLALIAAGLLAGSRRRRHA